MQRIALALALTLSGAACGATSSPPAGDDDGDDGGPGPGDDGGPGSVAPRAGSWRYSEITPVSSTCPAGTPTGENGNFVIDQVAAASFRVVVPDGFPPFTCALARSGFDCPDRASHVEDLRPTLDAVLSVRAAATGAFSDPTRGSGGQRATVSCTGSQCPLAGSFPCVVSVDFVIRAD